MRCHSSKRLHTHTSLCLSLCSGQDLSHTLSSVLCGVLPYSSHSILGAGGGNSGHLSSGVSWLMPHVVLRQPLQISTKKSVWERERTRLRKDECRFSGVWRALASPAWVSLPVPDSLPALLQHNFSSFTEICSPQGSAHSCPRIQHPSCSAAMSRGWDRKLACGERLWGFATNS